MKLSRQNFRASRRRHSAFSLLEILVAVGLLLVIVVGLLAMFSQAQRALRAGLTQTDVLEAGRATMQLIRGELLEMYPTRVYYPDVRDGAINFQASPASLPALVSSIQYFPGGSRDNVLHDLTFMTRVNDEWIAIAYRVGDAALGVGTLYRKVERSAPDSFDPNTEIYQLSANLAMGKIDDGGYHRVADGIVHFRCLAYDTNGLLFTTTNTLPGGFIFKSNALPAYVDFELGVLEPKALEQFRAKAGNLATAYLSNHPEKVHLFKQRIPIRSVP